MAQSGGGTPLAALQAYLKAGNTGGGDQFGYSVAVSGDTAVVGAPYEDSSTTGVNSTPNNSATDSGAAYVFVRSGGVWSQQAYLKASNPGFGDEFGWSVAVSGDTVVVGAPYEASSTTGVNSTPNNSAGESGAAYVFVRSGTNWSQQAYLKASNTGAGDRFGTSVAVSGDTAVVGAYGEDSSTTGVNSTPNELASGSGAAYVFVRSGGVWSQQAYLKASNTGADDFFGVSVSVSGDTVVVGATGENSSTTGVNSTPNESAGSSGAAYVFVRSGTNWSQQAYLKASNPGANDYFGRSVAVSGDTVVVGAHLEDSSTTGVNSTPNNSATDSGAAYVFVRSGGVWSQQAYLKAGNTGVGDQFGESVAVSGDTVVVGAAAEDSSTTGVNSTPNESASNAGAAYIFSGLGPAVSATLPTVSGISPASGSTAGGTAVTITGTGFTGATGVTIGGAAATSVTVDNATTITCVTPAGSAGTASVVVTTPAGANAANTLYSYAGVNLTIEGNVSQCQILTPQTLTATPSAGASVTKVEFFANTQKIWETNAAPWTATWLPLYYTTNQTIPLTAKATLSDGSTITSPAVNVKVTHPIDELEPRPLLNVPRVKAGSQSGDSIVFTGKRIFEYLELNSDESTPSAALQDIRIGNRSAASFSAFHPLTGVADQVDQSRLGFQWLEKDFKNLLVKDEAGPQDLSLVGHGQQPFVFVAYPVAGSAGVYLPCDGAVLTRGTRYTELIVPVSTLAKLGLGTTAATAPKLRLFRKPDYTTPAVKGRMVGATPTKTPPNLGSLETSGGDRKLIVLIPGNNFDGVRNQVHSAEFAELGKELDIATALNQDWMVVGYNWSTNAANTTLSGGDDNSVTEGGTRAAAVGYQHGLALGSYLASISGTGKSVKQIHLIAHSAGSWVAYGVSQKLLQLGDQGPVHQITLLDPYMPSEAPAKASVLGKRFFDSLAAAEMAPLRHLENYYADDILTLGATAQVFGGRALNANIALSGWVEPPAVVSIPGVPQARPLTPQISYSSHNGPIQWYADSVTRHRPKWGGFSDDQWTPPKGWETPAMGWDNSLFRSANVVAKHSAQKQSSTSRTEGNTANTPRGISLSGGSGSTAQGLVAASFSRLVAAELADPSISDSAVVPVEGGIFSFDFAFDSAASGDSLVLTFNDQTIWTYAGVDYTGRSLQGFLTTGPIDVSSFAGQSVTWKIRLQARSGQPAVARVDNILLQRKPVAFTRSNVPTVSQAEGLQTNVLGSLFELKPAVFGPQPIALQWLKDGSPLAEATNQTLTFAVAAGSAGSYQLRASNYFGMVTGAVYRLEVDATPGLIAITSQPTNVLVNASLPASFAATATGAAPLAYQWFKDGVEVTDATNTTLAFASVDAAKEGLYWLRITNSLGQAVSAPARLELVRTIAPTISLQPIPAIVNQGSTVAFSVIASGNPLPAYQWRLNSNALANATNAVLVLGNVQAGQAGSYDVVITNSAGSITSSVAGLVVNVPVAPAITNAPVSQSAASGGTASFTVGASGTGPLSYQWFTNGFAASGANGANFSLANVQPSQAGFVQVVVSNAQGAVTSGVVTLTVTGGVPDVAPTQLVGTALNVQFSSENFLRRIVLGTNNYEATTNGVAYEAGNYSYERLSSVVGMVMLSATNPVARSGWQRRIAALFNTGSTGVFSDLATFPNLPPLTYTGTFSLSNAPVLPPVDTNAIVNLEEQSGWVKTQSAPEAGGAGGNLVLNAGRLVDVDSWWSTYLNTNMPLVGSGYYRWKVYLPPGSVPRNGPAVLWRANDMPPNGESFYQLYLDHDAETHGSGRLHFSGVLNGNGTTLAVTNYNQKGVILVEVEDTGARVKVRFDGQLLIDLPGVLSNSGRIGLNAGWSQGHYFDEIGFTAGLSIVTQPQSQVAVFGSNVTFSVTAQGAGLNYQWRKGGTPLPNATNSSLALTSVNRANAGSYSVAVSGTAGSLVSSNALLRVLVPQRFTQPPQRLGNGQFRLQFGDTDGATLTAGDIPNIEVWGTTNLFNTNAWVRLTNGISVVNGQVQVDDAGSAGLPRRFYRVIER